MQQRPNTTIERSLTVKHDRGVPSSKNTERLLTISKTLLTMNTSLLKVQPVMSEAVIMTVKIDGYVTNVVKTFDFIDTALSIFHEAVQLLKYLGKLIPTIGPMLSQAAEMISKLDIESKVRKVLDEIKRIVETAQKKVIANFKRIVTTISSNLDSITSKLPIWQEKLDIMGRVFKLVDVIFYSLANTIDVRDIEQKMMQELNKISGGIFDGLHNLYEAFRPIQEFIVDVWQKFKITIGDALSSGLETFSKMFQPFFDVMKNCMGVLDKVKEVFKPFFWVMDAISWLWDRTIGRLIAWVEEELGIKAFIEGLVNKLRQALGIDELKETIRAMFEDAVSGCCDSLRESVDGDNSIVSTVAKFSDTMSNYKNDPAGTLVEVLLQAFDMGPPLDPILAPNALNPEDILDFLHKPKPLLPTYQFSRHESSIMSVSYDLVQLQQRAMDGFLAGSASNSGNLMMEMATVVVSQSRSESSDSAPMLGSSAVIDKFQQPAVKNIALDTGTFAPKLNYATYQDESLSIVLRTSHKSILESYKASSCIEFPGLGNESNSLKRAYVSMQSEELAPTPTTKRFKKGDSQTLDEQRPVAPATQGKDSVTLINRLYRVDRVSDAARPGFSRLTTIVARLGDVTTSAIHEVQAVATAFSQADKTFAAFDNRSIDFVAHLTQLLHSLEPILDVVENLLDMPFHYRKWLATIARSLSSTELDAEHYFNAIYGVLESLKQCTGRFQEHRLDLISRMKELEETYSKFGTHVKTIRSQSSFPKTLGPNVSSLSSFGEAIEARLVATLGSFTQAVSMADSIFTYPLGANEPEFRTELDHVCHRLAERAETILGQVAQVPDKVQVVHSTLRKVHTDAQSFYESATLASRSCRTLEAKLITADKISDFCARVNNVFAPLQSVLQALGFEAEDDEPRKKAKLNKTVMQSTLNALKKGDLVADQLPSLAAQKLDRLANAYFHFNDLEAMIHNLDSQMTEDLPMNLHQYDEALMALFDLVKSQETFTITPGDSMPQLLIDNALFDDQTQKDLLAIMSKFQQLAEKNAPLPVVRREPLTLDVHDPVKEAQVSPAALNI